MVLKSRAEEDALVAQRTAELGGGFWARVKAGRECRAPTTVGCVSAVSRDELSDVLDGRLAGSEVAPLKELARSLKAGKERYCDAKGRRRRRRRPILTEGFAARRERPAVVCDPAKLVVQPAVDGLVKATLERHLRAHPDVAIDYDAWAARARPRASLC